MAKKSRRENDNKWGPKRCQMMRGFQIWHQNSNRIKFDPFMAKKKTGKLAKSGIMPTPPIFMSFGTPIPESDIESFEFGKIYQHGTSVSEKLFHDLSAQNKILYKWQNKKIKKQPFIKHRYSLAVWQQNKLNRTNKQSAVPNTVVVDFVIISSSELAENDGKFPEHAKKANE